MVNKAKFDRADVIQKACFLFWKKGFYATSIRDIQQATDMRPGSIYATFGSKQGLFSETLHYYAHSMANNLDQCLKSNESVLAGLESFVRKTIFDNRDQKPSDLCMLIKVNSELTSDDPTLLALNQTLLSDFEQRLSDVFRQAQKMNELSTKLKPVSYAQNFQVQFSGLRSYLNRPDKEKFAHGLINQIFQSIKQI